MTLNEPSWSSSEKKVARAAYDKALERALASIMAEFKRRANAATTASEVWEVEDYLKEQRRDLDRTFDYRYSQLTMIFAILIRQGYLDENLLSGLSEEKRNEIRRMLA
ncbi:hypothetical protein [Mesorhizobium sp.]|uniref:hypothetical protein n=1 Tax=Mesorhizobium sp. TaxID=1871066 RepID=UPI0025C04EE1|nr:hypothetical protein [Mesorhizobium sp.]